MAGPVPVVSCLCRFYFLNTVPHIPHRLEHPAVPSPTGDLCPQAAYQVPQRAPAYPSFLPPDMAAYLLVGIHPPCPFQKEKQEFKLMPGKGCLLPAYKYLPLLHAHKQVPAVQDSKKGLFQKPRLSAAADQRPSAGNTLTCRFRPSNIFIRPRIDHPDLFSAVIPGADDQDRGFPCRRTG